MYQSKSRDLRPLANGDGSCSPLEPPHAESWPPSLELPLCADDGRDCGMSHPQLSCNALPFKHARTGDAVAFETALLPGCANELCMMLRHRLGLCHLQSFGAKGHESRRESRGQNRPRKEISSAWGQPNASRAGLVFICISDRLHVRRCRDTRLSMSIYLETERRKGRLQGGEACRRTSYNALPPCPTALPPTPAHAPILRLVA